MQKQHQISKGQVGEAGRLQLNVKSAIRERFLEDAMTDEHTPERSRCRACVMECEGVRKMRGERHFRQRGSRQEDMMHLENIKVV